MGTHDGHAELLFLGPNLRHRAAAFVRFLSFVVLSVCLFFIAWWLISVVVIDPSKLPVELAVVVQVSAELFAALAATAVMARFSGRALSDFGWAGANRLHNFLTGTATGLSLVTLQLLAMALASAVIFGPLVTVGMQALFYGVFYALLMFGAAVAEESLCRGYALSALSQAISFWPAALITSILFALLHAPSSGENVVGIASSMLFGLVAAFSYRHTGTLWFAYGLHGAWDYAETFIFGVPNSGTTLAGGLFHPRFHGPAWLTGGSDGPEASVLVRLRTHKTGAIVGQRQF
jgi:CAAX protease family protein